MGNFGSNRDKLDYSEILFRQVNRVSELFCETVIPFGSGKNYSIPAKNCFGGIVGLEALIKYKLPANIRKEFIEKKKRLGLDKHGADSDTICPELNETYFDLVMEYIFKSNLLPTEREGVDTE